MNVEMHEASPETTAYIDTVVKRLRAESKGNVVIAMSLAISICARIFLELSGNIDAGEKIGEMVKQGLITTLDAYKKMATATHRNPGSKQ